MPKSWKATGVEHSRCSMCLLSDTCIICWGSIRTSLLFTLFLILYCDQLGYDFRLHCHAPDSALNQVLLFTRSYCFLICVASDHFQNIYKWIMSPISSLICYYHLLSITPAIWLWQGDYFFLLQEVLVDFILGWTCNLDGPTSSWYLTQGPREPGLFFLQHEGPYVWTR